MGYTQENHRHKFGMNPETKDDEDFVFIQSIDH